MKSEKNPKLPLDDGIEKNGKCLIEADRLQVLRHKIQLLVDKYGMDMVLEALQEETCRLTLDGDGKAERVFNVLKVCREELNYDDVVTVFRNGTAADP